MLKKNLFLKSLISVLCLVLVAGAPLVTTFSPVAYAAPEDEEVSVDEQVRYGLSMESQIARVLEGGEAMEVVHPENRKEFVAGDVVTLVGQYGEDYVIKEGMLYYLYPKASLEIILTDPIDRLMVEMFGEDGLISKTLPELEDVLRNAVIKEARKHLGKPYVWGSKGPDSFDCSGLSKFGYLHGIGYELPDGSYNQDDTPVLIKFSEAKAGDLLFFKSGARGRRLGVNHVGFYAGVEDGEDMILHAKGEKWGVVYEELNRAPIKVVSPIQYILSRLPQVIRPNPEEVEDVDAETEEAADSVIAPSGTRLPFIDENNYGADGFDGEDDVLVIRPSH